MIDFKFTKTKKILEVNNCMCHNYYYIVYGYITNKERTKIRRFKFIEWFDIFDLQEFFEKDFITENDISEYVDDLIDNITYSYIINIKDFNDTSNIRKFYNYCNETIEHYNKIIK